MLQPSVLIVGDDPHLLRTQTELLGDCRVVTTCSRDAEEAVWPSAFDLLIIGETVPPSSAQRLLVRAGRLHPQPKILLVGRQHKEWYLGSASFYTVTPNHSSEFQTSVAALLACDQSRGSEIARLRKIVS
jgi:hypothetical protein